MRRWHRALYLSLDAAASTGALSAVAARVQSFLPWYSSVHRGAGWKSQLATADYEQARDAFAAFAERTGTDDVAIICRNTTEAITISPTGSGSAATTWSSRPLSSTRQPAAVVPRRPLPLHRVRRIRNLWCGGRRGRARRVAPPTAACRHRRLQRHRLGPPIDEIIAAAHDRGVPVLVDAAQLAPHRPLPRDADYVARSGHKMYAPFGAGVLIGPRSTFATGEEAGSPNLVGAVVRHATIDELNGLGWDAMRSHDDDMARRLRNGLTELDGVRLLGPSAQPGSLPVASFIVHGMSHALVAARLSAEHAIGVRHGCFCAHHYLVRLLGMSALEIADYRAAVLRGDRHRVPGAVRASAGIATSTDDIDRFLDALARIVSSEAPPATYDQDEHTGDYWPRTDDPAWSGAGRRLGAPCARG